MFKTCNTVEAVSAVGENEASVIITNPRHEQVNYNWIIGAEYFVQTKNENLEIKSKPFAIGTSIGFGTSSDIYMTVKKSKENSSFDMGLIFSKIGDSCGTFLETKMSVAANDKIMNTSVLPISRIKPGDNLVWSNFVTEEEVAFSENSDIELKIEIKIYENTNTTFLMDPALEQNALLHIGNQSIEVSKQILSKMSPIFAHMLSLSASGVVPHSITLDHFPSQYASRLRTYLEHGGFDPTESDFEKPEVESFLRLSEEYSIQPMGNQMTLLCRSYHSNGNDPSWIQN